MVIRGFISETKHKFGFILTDYTQDEIDELRGDCKLYPRSRLMIGPDNFTMIWFDREEDKNWFLLKWRDLDN